MQSRLVITPGDPDGIGYEILLRLIRENKLPASCDFTFIGTQEGLKEFPDSFSKVIAPAQAQEGLFLPGYQSGWCIEKAVEGIQNNQFDALVTGPIHKARLNQGGYPYDGHTGMLTALTHPSRGFPGASHSNSHSLGHSSTSSSTHSSTMMLANQTLRVSLVTCHIGIHAVSASLTRQRLKTTLEHTVHALRSWWGIALPNVAVLGLNPHCGESGLFGREELDIIEPEISELSVKLDGIARVYGPLPADTYFAKQVAKKPSERDDAVVCMYHDQGLIPVKLLDFARTVNITLGLPLIRTSVDHGVGFDIVGKGIADPSSMLEAIQEALRIVKQVRKGTK